MAIPAPYSFAIRGAGDDRLANGTHQLTHVDIDRPQIRAYPLAPGREIP